MAVIHKLDSPGVARFEISGAITIDSVGTLKTELLGLLDEHRHLQLSLAAVEDLDSSAVQVLLYIQREALRREVVLHWLAFSAAVHEVLHLLNLQTQLAVTAGSAQ
jgi:anti-anti-sigma regulatory factor